ncbi:MAG TPA: hypothetical protein VMH87_13300 [Pseudomonadales bacterium]|nr:hypothetical protein [Pseudomonadales bacterium]
MHRKFKVFALAVTFLALAVCCMHAQSWSSAVTGRALPLKILEPKDFHTNQPVPMIIYLENLVAPRVGTDSDDSIIHDFLDEGYLVVVLDYDHNTKARMPFINNDMFEMRKEVLHKQFISGYQIDLAHVFIIPSGSRLLPNVTFYQDSGRTLAMDIIYPAHPVQPVGTVIEFSCDNQNRMGDSSLTICSDTILDGEATEGFAVAMADHPVPAPYKGLDPMPDCAWKIKSAVRTLRAQGAKLNLNGRIAPAGFSRGSGMALMLITTMGMSEFEGHGAHTNISSDVQGAVVMSGRFTYLDLLPNDHMIPRYNQVWGDRTNHLDFWRREGAMDYLEKPTLPLFLTINISEQPDALYQMTVLRKHLAELGNDEIFMMDPQPRGHKVTLVPELLNAMNAYLKQRLN